MMVEVRIELDAKFLSYIHSSCITAPDSETALCWHNSLVLGRTYYAQSYTNIMYPRLTGGLAQSLVF